MTAALWETATTNSPFVYFIKNAVWGWMGEEVGRGRITSIKIHMQAEKERGKLFAGRQ